MKKKIYIAIPTATDRLVSGLVNRLLNWTKAKEYDTRVFIHPSLFPLDNARNTIVKHFLETEADYLFWIDDDIIPSEDVLEKLARTLDNRDDIDAIGAVCFSMKRQGGQYFPYPVTLRRDEDNRYAVHFGEGIEEVYAVGGACIMIRREPLEIIERPYEFVYHADGTLALTCDFRIWEKFQDAGFHLFVDFSLMCDHQRECSIKGFQDLLNIIQD